MRACCLVCFIVLLSGCNPQKKSRARIEALEQSSRDVKYEIGIACMQYITDHGTDLPYSKKLVAKLIEHGFNAEAVLAVELLLKEHPVDAELFHLRGIAHRRQHQYELAVRDGERASRLQPENKNFSAELRASQHELQVWKEIDMLNNSLAQESDSFDILLNRAEKFYAIQAYDAALYDLGAISKMRSSADSIYYIEKVSSIYEKPGRPVETLQQMLDYFRGVR